MKQDKVYINKVKMLLLDKDIREMRQSWLKSETYVCDLHSAKLDSWFYSFLWYQSLNRVQRFIIWAIGAKPAWEKSL